MEQSNWHVEETCTGEFQQCESADFFERLKMHFVSYLVYPRVFTNNPNFNLRIGEVPPVMDPRVSGSTLFDTEYQASFKLQWAALEVTLSIIPAFVTNELGDVFLVWIPA